MHLTDNFRPFFCKFHFALHSTAFVLSNALFVVTCELQTMTTVLNSLILTGNQGFNLSYGNSTHDLDFLLLLIFAYYEILLISYPKY